MVPFPFSSVPTVLTFIRFRVRYVLAPLSVPHFGPSGRWRPAAAPQPLLAAWRQTPGNCSRQLPTLGKGQCSAVQLLAPNPVFQVFKTKKKLANFKTKEPKKIGRSYSKNIKYYLFRTNFEKYFCKSLNKSFSKTSKKITGQITERPKSFKKMKDLSPFKKGLKLLPTRAFFNNVN